MSDPKQLEAQYKPKDVKALASDRQVHAARFSPCGRFLAGGDVEGKVRRWGAASDEFAALPPVDPQGGWIHGIAFDKSGEVLFEGDSWGRLACWKHAGEKPERVWQVDAAHDGWIRDVALSPDGATLATCGADKAVRLWSAVDGKPVRELKGDSDDVFRIAFHPEGTSIASGDLQGTVRLWDATSGAVVRTFDAKILFKLSRLQDVGGVWALRFSPDGKTLAVGGTQPVNGATVQGIPTLLLFDAESGGLSRRYDLGAAGDVYVTDVAFHPAGFLMICTNGGPGQGKLLFLQPGDEKPFLTQTTANCWSVSLHPGGKRFALATTTAGNGNGRPVDKDGQYPVNPSSIRILEFPN